MPPVPIARGQTLTAVALSPQELDMIRLAHALPDGSLPTNRQIRATIHHALHLLYWDMVGEAVYVPTRPGEGVERGG